MKMTKPVLLTVFMMAIAPTSIAQQNGFSDGFCEKQNKSNDTVAWILDTSPEALAAFEIAGLTTKEVLSLHAAAFQSVQKDSRTKIRHRVYWSEGRTCDYENYLDAPCISWKTNDSPECGGYDFVEEEEECTVRDTEDTRGTCDFFDVCTPAVFSRQGEERYCTNACQSTGNGSTQGCTARPGTICTMQRVKECFLNPFSCDPGLTCLSGKCVQACSRNGQCAGDDVCYNNTCHGICQSTGETTGGVGGSGWNGRPRLLMCAENLDDNARSTFDIIRHEYIHTLGLHHSNDSNCSTSDGCEDELMCTPYAPDRFMSSGDGAGLRRKYGVGDGTSQTYNVRPVYGSNISPNNSISSFPFGGSSTFTPRIDCTPGGTATECVSVRGLMLGSSPYIVVTKLSGLGSTGHWATRQNWAYIPWDFTGEADVAISKNGQYAYVVAKTRTARRDQAAIVRVDLNNYGQISYYGAADDDTRRALQKNSFNPRIETMPITGQPFAVVRSRNRLDRIGTGIKFVFLNDYTMTARLTPIHTPDLDAILEEGNSTMWGDFDIDCAKPSGFSLFGECTLVGTAHNGSSDSPANKRGSFFATTIYQSVRWVYSNGSFRMVDNISGDTPISWSLRGGVAGIGGVTMIPNTFGYELLVSANKIIRGGGSNSYLFRFSDNSDVVHNSGLTSYDIDVDGCTTYVTNVAAVYGRTQHGGADLAWCEDCNTTASFKMYGNSDGFCF